MLVVCGIDPGTDGAIAFFSNGVVDRVVNYPTLLLKKGSKARSLDYHGLAAMFDPTPDHAFVEQTWNRPGEGHSGTLVGYYMATLACLAALHIPWTTVSPQEWKRHLRVPPKDLTTHKELSRARAKQLLPEGEEYWSPQRLVRTKAQAGGCAEAALICLYGLRVLPSSTGLLAGAA